MRIKYWIFLCAFAGLCHYPNGTIAQNIRSFYLSQVGVREATGHNDGVMVETYLHHVGLKRGNSWCGAFVSFCLDGAGVTNPRSGWAPAYFPNKRIIWTNHLQAKWLPETVPRSGDVFGIYFPAKNRIAHVGFIDRIEGSRFVTVEGNTNAAGSREGDGVYIKRRLQRQIFKVARWSN